MSYIAKLKPQEPLKGLDLQMHKFHGCVKRACLNNRLFLWRARRIEKQISSWKDFTAEELSVQLAHSRELAMRQKLHGEDLYKALAALAMQMQKTMGMSPYPVQLAAALALHEGIVCEMATGEGKSLTAAIGAALLGWRGQGCHVLTSNSYLAGRDAEEFRPFYEACGLTVGAIAEEDQADERREAYAADLTYCTNKDVAADFLRDQMQAGAKHNDSRDLLKNLCGQKVQSLVLRGLHYALVDEADSVLIDDAGTPLLISMEGEGSENELVYHFGRKLALAIDDKSWKQEGRAVKLNEAGKRWLQQQCAKSPAEAVGDWKYPRRQIELMQQALQAEHLYKLDREYVILEEKIVIIDQETGRATPDRFWRQGMHQSIEAKHKLEVSPPKDTCARISFQRFFQLYGSLCGMTGTAADAAGEFWHYYKLPVMKVPTHRSCLRKFFRTRSFSHSERKWQGIIDFLLKEKPQDQPVLIGTASIRDSEHLTELLQQAGLEPRVLNARNNSEEAEIVRRAGEPGAITVSTSMAGRGTDIKLKQKSKDAGGLLVICCQTYQSPRIDRQLYGRCSRQGDPGRVLAFISGEDLLLQEMLPLLSLLLKRLPGKVVFLPKFMKLAQILAVRRGRAQRLSVMQSDDWLQQMLGFSGESYS